MFLGENFSLTMTAMACIRKYLSTTNRKHASTILEKLVSERLFKRDDTQEYNNTLSHAL
jgi:hypothetical protein